MLPFLVYHYSRNSSKFSFDFNSSIGKTLTWYGIQLISAILLQLLCQPTKSGFQMSIFLTGLAHSPNLLSYSRHKTAYNEISLRILFSAIDDDLIYPINVEIFSNGTVQTYPITHLYAYCDFDFSRFPYDIQDCEFLVSSQTSLDISVFMKTSALSNLYALLRLVRYTIVPKLN